MRKKHVLMISVGIIILLAIISAFILANRDIEENDDWINEPGDEEIEEMIFYDVSEKHPLVEYMVFLNQREIMLPSGDGNFYPENMVSVKEFLEIVLKASMGRLDFNNLTSEKLLEILVENKVINNGEISINDLDNKVTNYDVAIILAKVDMKVRNCEQVIANIRYTDLKNIDEVGQTLISHSVGRGFFHSNTSRVFNPYKKLTRAELAEIIYLFINK